MEAASTYSYVLYVLYVLYCTCCMYCTDCTCCMYCTYSYVLCVIFDKVMIKNLKRTRSNCSLSLGEIKVKLLHFKSKYFATFILLFLSHHNIFYLLSLIIKIQFYLFLRVGGFLLAAATGLFFFIGPSAGSK